MPVISRAAANHFANSKPAEPFCGKVKGKANTQFFPDSVLACQYPARQITGQINHYNEQNHRDQDGGRFVHVE